MNKIQRIKALLQGEKLPTPAMAFWQHFPIDDTDSHGLAQVSSAYQNIYDWDFLKISYHGLYSIEDWGSIIQWSRHHLETPVVADFAIKTAQQWAQLSPLPVDQGALARELRATQLILEQWKNRVPVLPTIFSPSTTAVKMCGDTFLEHVQSDPASVHRGLRTITDTTVAFVNELAKLGIAGVFFATQLATFDRLTWDEYQEFGRPYDLEVLAALKGRTYFNILHIHGNNIMFKELLDYPVEALNWHDRRTFPSLAAARQLTDKILIGGIDENHVLKEGTPEELQAHLKDALAQVPDGRLILGPGCVVPLDCPSQQLALVAGQNIGTAEQETA